MNDEVRAVLEQFVTEEDSEVLLKTIAEWMVGARTKVDLNGRAKEINRMIKYHREMADGEILDSARLVHIETIAMLEDRLRKMNDNYKGNLPMPPDILEARS